MQNRLKAIQDHPRHTASLIIIDLDRFKLVNDSMGHAAGDEVLRIVGQRIRGQVRQSDLVARLGGDEFAVVVADMDTAGLVRLAERIRSSVEQPCIVEGRSVPQTISIGIAGADPLSSDAELMVRADRALYASKANGRNQSMVFDETLRDEVTARLTLERELRHAIDHDELKVLFQP